MLKKISEQTLRSAALNRDYKIIKRVKRKKTISLSIRPDEGIIVVAPFRTTVSQIEDLLKEKEQWINSKLSAFEKRIDSKKSYVENELFFYLGTKYLLKIIESDIRNIRAVIIANNQIEVLVPIGIEGQEKKIFIEKTLIRWYRKMANEVIEKAVRRFAILSGLQPDNIYVKNLKSSWGICRKNDLSFNWRLIMAPVHLIEYVVAHEICHLNHKNHAREFWVALSEIMPDYKIRKKMLNEMHLSLD